MWGNNEFPRMIDIAPAILKLIRHETLPNKFQRVFRILRHDVVFRVIIRFAGILEIPDIVPKLAQPKQIHQRAPRDPAVRISADDSCKNDVHRKSRLPMQRLVPALKR